jgi:hypothetical protein
MIFGDDMKLLTTQHSVFACYFIPLQSKYSPYSPVLRHPQFMLFPHYERTTATPTENYRQKYGFIYLTFTFLDSRQEDKTLN